MIITVAPREDELSDEDHGEEDIPSSPREPAPLMTFRQLYSTPQGARDLIDRAFQCGVPDAGTLTHEELLVEVEKRTSFDAKDRPGSVYAPFVLFIGAALDLGDVAKGTYQHRALLAMLERLKRLKNH